jgi:hypothetical protein
MMTEQARTPGEGVQLWCPGMSDIEGAQIVAQIVNGNEEHVWRRRSG